MHIVSKGTSDDCGWYYINPRDKPEHLKLTKLNETIEDLKEKIKTNQVMIPKEVVRRQIQEMAKKGEVHDNELLIIDIHDANFTHSFQERINIIASGKKDSAKCRYASEKSSSTKYPPSTN